MIDSATDPTALIHRDTEITRVNGTPVFLKKGPYGQYLECGSKRRSWKGKGMPSAEEAVKCMASVSQSGVLRELENWDIRKGVKSFPDYAQKRKGGPSKKPIRVPMKGYDGDYLKDLAQDVEEWIGRKEHSGRDQNSSKVR